MMKNAVIQVERLSRSFGAQTAVDGLSFEVYPGEVFGLLGPNGAGKTTTVRLLNGVLKPTSGHARILGLDPVTQGSQLRRQTGVLTETPSLYERLSAWENLSIFALLYGLEEPRLSRRVRELLDSFQLSSRLDDKVGGFSKGMKQRLALARALLHEPPLLFLDEPTAGLDPESAREVTHMIEQLSHQKGRMVFLCTHNLAEAQRLCDRVAVIDKGRLVALGSLEDLTRTLWQGIWLDVELSIPIIGPQAAVIEALPQVIELQAEAESLALRIEQEGDIPDVLAALVANGARITRLNPRQYTLEDIYFELQQKEARQ